MSHRLRHERAAADPLGELTYAMHVTIAAAWFDPADNTGIATPFMVQDALVEPMSHWPKKWRGGALRSFVA